MAFNQLLVGQPLANNLPDSGGESLSILRFPAVEPTVFLRQIEGRVLRANLNIGSV